MKKTILVISKFLCMIVALPTQFAFATDSQEVISEYSDFRGTIYYSNRDANVKLKKIESVFLRGSNGSRKIIQPHVGNVWSSLAVTGYTSDDKRVELWLTLPGDIEANTQIKAFENCEKMAQTKFLLGQNDDSEFYINLKSSEDLTNYISLNSISQGVFYGMVIGGDHIVQCGFYKPVNQ